MFLKRMPLKCENIMADDIRENAMTVSNSVDYVRGLKGKDSVLVTPTDLSKASGVIRFYERIEPNANVYLPFFSGLILVQNASHSEKRALAVIDSLNSGTVLVPDNGIEFFSVSNDNRICILYDSDAGKYRVKNTFSTSQLVIINLIG